jgi:hypothetical protein
MARKGFCGVDVVLGMGGILEACGQQQGKKQVICSFHEYFLIG